MIETQKIQNKVNQIVFIPKMVKKNEKSIMKKTKTGWKNQRKDKNRE